MRARWIADEPASRSSCGRCPLPRTSATPHLNLSLTGYLQPQHGRARDARALAVSALAIDVTDRLAVTVTFNLRHDSRPPDDIAPTDTALRTGVTLALGTDSNSGGS